MENDFADINLPKEKAPENTMALASLIMGILAVVGCCCCYLSIGFGAMSIIFALLSRADEPLSGKAKAGIGFSIAAVVLCILFFIFILVFNVSLFNNSALFYPDFEDLTLLNNIFVMGGGRS